MIRMLTMLCVLAIAGFGCGVGEGERDDENTTEYFLTDAWTSPLAEGVQGTIPGLPDRNSTQEMTCLPAAHEDCGSCGSNRMRWHQMCSNGTISWWNTWCNPSCAH